MHRPLPRSFKKRQKRSRRRLSPCWLILLLPILSWWGIRMVRTYFERPDAILVLGGSSTREQFAARFARQHPDLPIWISSGAPKEYTQQVFDEAGVDLQRLHLDYQAVDTVTNFTTLVDQFQQRGIRSVYLVTSDYHMRRARMIGEVVLGSRGIHAHPVTIASVPPRPEESMTKALRDGARSVLWVTTGRTGADLGHGPNHQWSNHQSGEIGGGE